MGTVSRGIKSAGGTSFTTGPILPAEVNTDLDTLYTLVNGQIDSANISPTANIPNSALAEIDGSAVADHADTDAQFIGIGTDPGDSLTPVKPTDLDGEIESLRYRIKANELGVTLYARNSAGSVVPIGWTEPHILGPNLLPNPGFEVQSGGAGTAPDGWTLSGSPTTMVIETPTNAAAGTDKRSLNIIGNGVGITKTIAGLKSNTKYFVGVQWQRTAGTLTLSTSGGLGVSANYGDVSVTTTSGSTLVTHGAVVKTDSSGSDITVSITTDSSASAEMNLFYAWFFELGDDGPLDIPSLPVQTATWSTEEMHPTSPSTPPAQDWDTLSSLTLSQYVPRPGYRLFYEVTVTAGAEEIAGAPDTNFRYYHHGFRIQLDTGGGAATVEGPYYIYRRFSGTQSTGGDSDIITMRYIVDDATPGLTYTFTTDIGVYVAVAGDYGYAIVNQLRDSQQSVSRARLYAERI